MTVYVDPLMAHGWILRGRRVGSCHMFSDQLDLRELHQMAERIGCRREWFQDQASTPHYDLTLSRRQEAIGAGAVPVDRRTAVGIWRLRRKVVEAQKDMITDRDATMNWISQQLRQAVKPEARVTCECQRVFTLPSMFRCFYCGAFFCPACAELHFGQTRAAYNAERWARMEREADADIAADRVSKFENAAAAIAHLHQLQDAK